MERVIRLWVVSDMNEKQKFFRMEMIIMDEKGDKIQASIRKGLMSRFENKIRKGIAYDLKYFGVADNTGAYRTTKHQFKLNLQNDIVVTEVGTGLIKDLEPTIVPRVISKFVEQTLLFKIDVKNDVNYGFEQSFHVKKVCIDKDIVTRFKSAMKNYAGVEDDLTVGVVHSELVAGVVQGLNSKFENLV
ncbi:hypothetical protein KIW84_063667 [Lathyrus oleraceus]|uniref:Replication protein A 70 kDa DNA-binding subunit B/D first OB fold domain-containing protein n=1 Tax=Pisum sativum TaxID=3888 RepID=A0A9D5A7K6_PEA|nr:hypothetical protein KIW84_063667 [Pisum sativum]